MPKASHLQVSKKTKVSVTIAIYLALLVSLYLFVITSTLSRIWIANSTRIQEQKNCERRWESPEPTWSISCDRTHFDYELCYLNRPTIVDPTTATFFTVDPTNSTPQLMEKIRPFPRNFLHTPISLVRELTLTTTAPPNTSCAVIHPSPALVFSAGGWTKNFYHVFNEIFIPLFITVDKFFPDHDFVIGIFDCSDGWLRRYNDLLSSYTRHRIINLDQETITHCFPSAIVGLISHGPSIVDPTLQRRPHPKTLHDFHTFVADTYTQSHHAPPRTPQGQPRLVFLNRNGTREILNKDDVRRAAEDAGFEVVVFEPTQETAMHEAFRLIDSSHALIGVHGAGLTHMLFMRPGSVLMQMVPAECHWLASLCYGKMAVRLGLEYIVYNIGEEESLSEWGKPRRDGLPQGVTPLENWIWNKDQLLIKLDLDKVKRYLKRAYEKAKRFMHKESLNMKHSTRKK